MNEHTACLKITRRELAEIKFALFAQYEAYKKDNYNNLADYVLTLWKELDKPFEKLYSDVD